jgi:hypothetical protein
MLYVSVPAHELQASYPFLRLHALFIGVREDSRRWAPDAWAKGQNRAQKHSPALEFFSKVVLQGCGGGSGQTLRGSSD